MPLSEYEQRVLDQLEQQLASEDPKLESRLTAPPASRRGRVSLGLALVVVGLAALVIGLVVSVIWVSMGGFVVMFAGAYWALTTPKAGQAGAKKAAKAPSPKKRSRMQERFERRFEERGDN
jgi:hypothetical protein